jgi:hypothetical protein
VRKSNTTFAVAFALCFPVAFIFTRHMEVAGRFDSIGLGYTLLVASAFSAMIAGIGLLIFLLLARRRNRPPTPPL